GVAGRLAPAWSLRPSAPGLLDVYDGSCQALAKSLHANEVETGTGVGSEITRRPPGRAVRASFDRSIHEARDPSPREIEHGQPHVGRRWQIEAHRALAGEGIGDGGERGCRAPGGGAPPRAPAAKLNLEGQIPR